MVGPQGENRLQAKGSLKSHDLKAGLASVGAAAGFVLEMGVRDRKAVGVADDEAGVGLLGGPRRRETARAGYVQPNARHTGINEMTMRRIEATAAQKAAMALLRACKVNILSRRAIGVAVKLPRPIHDA